MAEMVDANMRGDSSSLLLLLTLSGLTVRTVLLLHHEEIAGNKYFFLSLSTERFTVRVESILQMINHIGVNLNIRRAVSIPEPDIILLPFNVFVEE